MVNRLAVALNDLTTTFDRAIRKAATPRIARALCTLRDEAEEKLRRAADGYGRRSPAEIIAETLDRIRDLVGGGGVTALAKRAAGPVEPEGEDRTAALVELAKEFAELARSAERACTKLGAEPAFAQWRHRHHETLSELLRRGDLAGAKEDLAHARRELNAMLDAAQVQHALDGAGEQKALMPGWHRM